MKHAKRLLSALLLSALLPPALALEAREGLVKIVVDEATARVSLYRLVDVAKGRYEPFLFDQDPRTSYATLSVEGRQYRLGDASEFQKTVSRTERGVRIEFKSSFCAVVEELEFLRSAGAALADGVRLSFSLENVSQKDATVGLRLLLDTFLAEKSGLHFRTPSRERVGEETLLEGERLEAWVATPGERSELMVLLSGSLVDRPDRVHLANWKRLNDVPWLLEASGARNFTLLPYSVNDSGLALYWLPTALARGASRRLSLVLGAFNEAGYPDPAAASAASAGTEALFAQTVLNAPAADPTAALAADLVAVRDLITRIDGLLAAGRSPSPEEVAAWKRILESLEARKREY